MIHETPGIDKTPKLLPPWRCPVCKNYNAGETVLCACGMSEAIAEKYYEDGGTCTRFEVVVLKRNKRIVR